MRKEVVTISHQEERSRCRISSKKDVMVVELTVTGKI
jgi:hypothetical protein